MTGPKTSFPMIHGSIPAEMRVSFWSSSIDPLSTRNVTRTVATKNQGTPWAKYSAQTVPNRVALLSCIFTAMVAVRKIPNYTYRQKNALKTAILGVSLKIRILLFGFPIFLVDVWFFLLRSMVILKLVK